jgi:hypothetical protein
MNELLEILKVGGPTVATAVAFLWYIDRMDKRANTLICNHFEHITDVINRNTEILASLSILIKKLGNVAGPRGERGLRGPRGKSEI